MRLELRLEPETPPRADCPGRRAEHEFVLRNGGGGGISTHGRLSPTHAFEACSFGRSDTPPWGRVLEPVPLKEIEQDLWALLRADSADHLDQMRGPTVAYDVPHPPTCAGLLVPSPQH